MAESLAPSSGRIFISYRREETAYAAGWLYDRLANRFGVDQIFKDVDSIDLGDDFVEVITRAVGSCDVLLALVGEEWLTITNEDDGRRLDDPDDFVRLEIEAALSRDTRVIPILVDGARMPHAKELPPSLAGLVRRQALELSPARFEYDTGRLLTVLERTLAEVHTARLDAAAISARIGKALDASTQKPPTAPERREQAQPSPTPRPSPAAHTTPAEARPASKLAQPPGKPRRRLTRWARILAGAGVALVLLVAAIKAADLTSTESDLTSTESVILEDDFSSKESGWDVFGTSGVSSDYTNDAYRMSSEEASTSPGSAPRNASSVYPSAPPNLRIEIDAKRLGGESLSGYAIACRADTTATGLKPPKGAPTYNFLVGDGYAIIAKEDAAFGYRELKRTDTPAIDVNATNHIQAECTNVEGERAVHLVFSVNGQVIAEETDRENPLLAGTVALFVFNGEAAEKAVEVEFDNFVVTET